MIAGVMIAGVMVAGPKIGRSISSWLALAQPMSGNLDFATNPVGGKHEVDRAPKLIGYQITNYAGPVSRPGVWHDLGATALHPLDTQPAVRLSVLPLAPAHADIASRSRKCAKFGGIGGELMDHHCDSLARIRAQNVVGPVDACVGVGRIRRELALDQLSKRYSLPAPMA